MNSESEIAKLNSREGLLTSNQNDTTDTESVNKNSYKNNQYRWVFIILACITMFGSYFTSQAMMPLQNYFMTIKQITPSEFNLIGSVSAFPGIVTAMVVGYIIDKWGISVCIILSCIINTISQLIFLTGCMLTSNYYSYLMILLSSIISGLFGDLFDISIQCIFLQWFRSREISFAFAFSISISSAGDALNNLVIPSLYQSTGGFFWPYFVGVIAEVISIGTAIGMYFMDKKCKEQEKNRTIVKASTKRASLSDIKNFPIEYWLIILAICCSESVSIFLFYFLEITHSWITLCQDQTYQLMQMFNYTNDQANNIMFVALILGVGTPIVGILVDFLGKRICFGLLGQMMILASLITMLLLPTTANYFLVNFIVIFEYVGIYIFQSSVWVLIAFVVKEKNLGTGNGIKTSLGNGMITLTSYTMGWIIQYTTRSGGFFYAILQSIGFTTMSLILMSILFVINYRKKGILNSLTNMKAKLMERRVKI